MGSLAALRQLLRQSHHARPEDLPEMAMRAGALLGARSTVIYVVDHQQRILIPLLGGSAPERVPVAVDGTLAGRAYTMVTPCAADGEESAVRLWVPLLDGAERLGVLEIIMRGAPDDDALDECVAVSSLLAELMVTRSLYSDTIERIRRRNRCSWRPRCCGRNCRRSLSPPVAS